jgi:ABC-2 type transport system permease protein
VTPLSWQVQLLALLRKEIAQIAADPRLIRLLIAAPVVQLLVFAAAVDFEVDRIPVAVVDQDQTSESRRVLDQLLADGTLVGTMHPDDPAAALTAMDNGEIAAMLVVPPRTTANRLAGRPAPIQVVLDGTDVRRSTVAAAAAAAYFARADGAPPPSLALAPRILSNPTLDTPPYMVPGLAAMVLVITTTLVTAMGLAREREVGTLEQILVTPIPSGILLAGKVLPYAVIGLFSASLCIGLGSLVYGVPIRGSLLFLGFAAGLYLLNTLGAGLLVASFARTQQQAFMGGFLFMIPAILLSGNMTPVIAMPKWLELLTRVNPLRWSIEAFRASLLEGAGPVELWPHALALATLGTLLFGTAVLRFRRNLL